MYQSLPACGIFFRKKFSCAESCAEEITYLLYTLSIPLV